MSEKIEMLDIYDGTGKHIGTKARGAVHKDGNWHKTFHCWVIFSDKSGDGYVILQKRSENKSSWAGYVDVSAAGHYMAGEKLNDGLREVREELGINVSMESLIPLGIRVCVEEFDSTKVNHEFQDVFFLIGDSDLGKYNIQGEELSGLMKARIEDLLALFSKNVDSVTAEGFELQDSNGNLVKKPVTYKITRDKFIPMIDNYNYKIMILARRALKGEKHLLI